MVLGQHALGLVGGYHWQAEVLGDLAEPCGGAALDDASAGEEDRAFGISEGGPDVRDRRRGRGRWLGQLDGPGLGDIGRVSLNVHGHGDEHGPRTPTRSEGVGLRHDPGKLIHARDLP